MVLIIRYLTLTNFIWVDLKVVLTIRYSTLTNQFKHTVKDFQELLIGNNNFIQHNSFLIT